MKLVRIGLLACVFTCAWLPAAFAQQAAPALAAGTRLEAALATLNAQGHRIVYSSALVRPDMTLRTAPAAARIDALLREILAPWNLRAIPAANGDWLIVAVEPANSEAANPPPAAEEEILTVDVTASRYALATVETSATFLDRAGVERLPHLADDAVRMLKVLPGVSGGDFSAALNIRGGRRDETMLVIDGAEIHNGFHFRDLTGALSVLDTHLVEGIDLITGGMTADYGDYMSGVVDMHTRRASEDDDYRSAAGISFVSAYARTGGTFSDGRGSWLVAGRRGYLDVIMERVQEDDEQMTPRYTDLFASMDFDFSERTKLSVRTLLAADELKLVTHAEDDANSAGDASAGHLWATLEHAFNDSLRTRTLVSVARATETRDADGVEEERAGDVLADYRFDFLDLRQDWAWTVNPRNLLRAGFNLGRSTADYDYALTGIIFDIPAFGGVGAREIEYAHDLRVSGSKSGGFAAWRSSLTDALTTEIGARWDQYRYGGGLHFDEISPRFNAVYALGESGELRAAWGIVHQPQGVNELQIEDDVTNFFGPERADQAVLGYLHRFAHGLSLRTDVYRKKYSNLRPRFENALDQVQLIPEAALDRVRIDATEAEASGVEVTLRREAELGLTGWLSVALAKARERDADGWTSRTWEQRESLSFGASWTGVKWNVSVVGLFHSGAPTTDLRLGMVTLPGGALSQAVVAGPRNAERLGDYQRIDIRVNREQQLRSGRLSYYFEVMNLLDRENPCCVEDIHLESTGAGPRLVEEQSYWLPMLPSFGVQFEF